MKMEWRFEGVEDPETIDQHIAHSKSLGLPHPVGTGKTRLAVVGAGPSVLERIDEIKAFDGDTWIIGSAYPWAAANGIKGIYFNIDPSEDCAEECIGAHEAILGASIHPGVFTALNGAKKSVFDLVETSERMNHGVTTATAVPELALLMDYTEVIFYGCESSFEERMHVCRENNSDKWMVVESDGRSFKTGPAYYAQAEFLATIIRKFPQHFKERSGGFLRAMVNTMDYDLTHATRALYNTLTIS
jgi:hypothetical protein